MGELQYKKTHNRCKTHNNKSQAHNNRPETHNLDVRLTIDVIFTIDV